MLTGRDKETGLGLSDQNIKNNVRESRLYSRIAADLAISPSF